MTPHRPKCAFAAALFAIAIGSAGCASAGQTGQTGRLPADTDAVPGAGYELPPPPPLRPASSVKSSPAAIADARADSMRRPYTAHDIEFMSHMISHHAQAVKMTEWARTHGGSKGVRVLAARIGTAQTAEIEMMQHWLSDRNQPVPEADHRGMKMDMGGVEHMMLMPGMLTEEQMKSLEAARGVEFDRLFLTYMIQHHEGAISMVDKLFASYGAAQDEVVFKFATDVNADQNTEIERMQLMLGALSK